MPAEENLATQKGGDSPAEERGSDQLLGHSPPEEHILVRDRESRQRTQLEEELELGGRHGHRVDDRGHPEQQDDGHLGQVGHVPEEHRASGKDEGKADRCGDDDSLL